MINNSVSIGVFEQVRWERDVAISQLAELGIGFGQKKPDMVEVVRCRDCANCEAIYCFDEDTYDRHCMLSGLHVKENGFCNYGVMMK